MWIVYGKDKLIFSYLQSNIGVYYLILKRIITAQLVDPITFI
jgi:hypothetical protein